MGDLLENAAVHACVFTWVVNDPLLSLAYIDPGSGTFALQIAAASVLGVAYTLKTFWRSLWQKVTGGKRRRATDTANSER